MNEAALTIIIALGTGLAGSFATWFFGRKKSNIETIDAAVDTWQKVVDNLKKQIDDLIAENGNLRQEVEKLRVEIEKLKQATKKIERYEKRIKELEDDLAYMSALCDSRNIKYKLPSNKTSEDNGKPKNTIGFRIQGKDKSTADGDKKGD